MKLTLTLLLLLSLIIYFAPFWGKSPQGERRERIKRSPNFIKGEFSYPIETPQLTNGATYGSLLKEMLLGKSPEEPLKDIPAIKQDLYQLPEGSIVWFGHSSYLIKIQGKVFVIDPVLSDRVSPVPGLMKAYTGTTVYSPTDLPEIDYLIITHDHYDHLDYTSIKELKPKVKKVITGLGVGAHLEYWGYKPEIITELDWWEGISLSENIQIAATPARHFSGRGFKRNQTLWCSFVLDTPENKIFIGGDSGYGPHFKEIGEKFGPFDLAILENGQYNVAWQNIHTLPSEFPLVVQDLRAMKVLPVHSGKFTLARHAWYEPLEEVYKLIPSKKLLTPLIGQTVPLADSSVSYRAWWREF
ncbi:MBL fold metallo-hydrolase [Leadbetterella byssophila]|uniref:MBL fold metallo-hydrolase n=1 Tax=Leadbetterella byssophila TaxID=316068 RepID=UPI0039A1CD96